MLSVVIAISNTTVGTTSYYGYANQVNFWMSAMKFFGQGIDRESECSTTFTQFSACYSGATAQAYGSFVLAFNLEGLHDSDDEFRSCMPLDGTTTQLTFTTGLAPTKTEAN